MDDLKYSEFKKNPLLYLLFLPLLVLGILYFAQRKTEKESNEFIKEQLRENQMRAHRADSINHALYEILGAKSVIEKIGPPKK